MPGPGTLAVPNVFNNTVGDQPFANLDNNFITVQNYVNARQPSSGLLANRPAAGNAGALYFSTDTGAQFLDTGAAWLNISPAAPPEALTGLTLSNDGASPNTVLDIAVGAATSEDAAISSRAVMSLTAAYTKTTGAWAVGSGNGGLATIGAITANVWYHVFLIMRPDTGVVDIAFDTDVTGANIQANTGAAYTKRRRIGSFKTATGTTNILTFVQDGDYFRWKASILDVDNTNPGNAAVTRTLTVPLGLSVIAIGNISLFDTAAGVIATLSDLAANDEAPVITAAGPLGMVTVAAASQAAQGQYQIRTNTLSQIRSRCGTSTANTIIRCATIGWIDRRGRG